MSTPKVDPREPPPQNKTRVSRLLTFLLILCSLTGCFLCVIGVLNDSDNSADVIGIGAGLLLIAITAATFQGSASLLKIIGDVLRRLL